jgi:exoribonuclease II
MQKEMLSQQIDRVEVAEGVVDQRTFISEWIANSEQLVYEKIKEQIEKNRKNWEVPATKVICADCQAENAVAISLDQASFFGTA